MIPNEDSRASVEVFGAHKNLETDASEEGHCVFKGTCSSPLGTAVVREDAQNQGCEDAIDGTEKEGSIRGEETGVEGGTRGREHDRDGEQSDCDGGVGRNEVEDDRERRIHFLEARCGWAFEIPR